MSKKSSKIVSSALVTLMLLLTGLWAGCGKKTAPGAQNGEHTGFYVDGTVLRDANGEAFIMRGINHAHCWYTGEDEVALDAIAATGANCVRIVCADGQQWTADTAESLADMIEAARSRDMVAVLEVHDGTGKNNKAVLEHIVDFWCETAEVFEGTESYCILNIANEWRGDWNTGAWSKAYCEAIPRLREAGIHNTLMVDAAGWGQFGRSIRSKGLKVFESDPEANTMFSVHMYGMSGGSEGSIRRNLEGAASRNLCVCVGEFGYTHSDGDVKEDYLMEYCEQQGIGYLAWSWKGNSGGVEYLDLAMEWDGSVLSADWGDKVVNGPNGIRLTAKKCTVFE